MATFKTSSINTIDIVDTIDVASAGSNCNDLYTTVTTGTGGYTYTSITPYITMGDSTSALSVKGDADIEGDVRVQGRSLAEFMAAVEQRLNMLQPNPDLEAEWDQLRELGKQYRDLEQQLMEKSKMWHTLKR